MGQTTDWVTQRKQQVTQQIQAAQTELARQQGIIDTANPTLESAIAALTLLNKPNPTQQEMEQLGQYVLHLK